MKWSWTCIDYWQPEVEGPGFCSRVFGWSWVGWEDGRVEGRKGTYGSTSHSASQETKYYLLFEERHSRYLLYRGGGVQRWANLKTRVKRLDAAWSLNQGRLKRTKESKSSHQPSRTGDAGRLFRSVSSQQTTFKRRGSRDFLWFCFLWMKAVCTADVWRLGVYQICCFGFKSPSWYDKDTM